MGFDGGNVYGACHLSLYQVPNTLVATRTVGESAAVQRFVECARTVRPGFGMLEHNADTIPDLCRRPNGIPLAPELAAAGVAVLSVDQMVARLAHAQAAGCGNRRAPAQQQTLRATLDWSCGLLPETERLLFRCLCGFAGGWTPSSAETFAATRFALDDGYAVGESTVSTGGITPRVASGRDRSE
jgi:predicted ATPase